MAQGNPNPSPETRFGGARGNSQSPGGWKKEESISYQYKKLMRMTPEEFNDFVPNTVAEKVALQRLKNAIKEEGLYETKEITDRTEGKAPQFIGVGGEDEYKKALVEFVNTGKDE